MGGGLLLYNCHAERRRDDDRGRDGLDFRGALVMGPFMAMYAVRIRWSTAKWKPREIFTFDSVCSLVSGI